jgi:1-acyl-sn-glycerol-3-phosphate acyltransferase
MPDNNIQTSPDEKAERLLVEVQRIARRMQPNLASIDSATLDSLLDRELGFDSLGRVELIAHIEKEFQVRLPEQIFSEAETPRDLLRSLMTAQHASPEDLQRIELQQGDALESPQQAQTLLEMLDWHARRRPDYPHIRLLQDGDDSLVISYAELQRQAQQAAASLQHQGLQPGETVALMLPTGEDYFVSFFAILYAGGIPVPIYPPARPAQLEDHMHRQAGILINAGCRFLITIGQARMLANMLRAQVESMQGVLTLSELMEPSGAYSQPAVQASDTAFIQYTSGSTGNPKGVVLTHANLLTNIRVDGATVNADSNDVFVSWLPLYHDMGLIGAWLGSLYFGVQLIIMSPLSFLARPVRWLQALHRYGGTLSAAPNFAYELCLNRIEDHELEGLDLSSWRMAMNGAEAVSPETIKRFTERFAPYGFRAETMYPVYGLAECSVGLAFPPLGREPRIDRIKRDEFSLGGRAEPANEGDVHSLSFVCCGSALHDHELRIVDAASQELPERYQGRLQFRGPSATSGYFRNPEATASLFDGDWLETGDLAYLADGELFITGRSKDVIIRGGRNIYPHELEHAVGEVDGIRKGRVVAFATQDQQRQTEQLVVLAETREQDEAARATLIQRISELTAEIAGIAADDIVLAPPGSVLKTSSGKIRRAACKELYEQGRVGQGERAVWMQLLSMQMAALPDQLRRWLVQGRRLAYALYSQAVFRLLAILLGIAVLVIPISRWRWALLRPFARSLAMLTATRFNVDGLDNLLPQDQNCIYVANHSSYLDSYTICAALPRRFRFIAKAELTRQWLPRTFLGRIGTLFVERFDHADGLASLETIEQAASAGDSLFFFPEGTFTHAPGLRPFRLGAFIAAVRSGLPIVPVAIDGTRSILTGNNWYAHHGEIRVTVGETIQVEKGDDPEPSEWEQALRLRDQARAQILQHCGEPDMGHEQVFPPRD